MKSLYLLNYISKEDEYELPYLLTFSELQLKQDTSLFKITKINNEKKLLDKIKKFEYLVKLNDDCEYNIYDKDEFIVSVFSDISFSQFINNFKENKLNSHKLRFIFPDTAKKLKNYNLFLKKIDNDDIIHYNKNLLENLTQQTIYDFEEKSIQKILKLLNSDTKDYLYKENKNKIIYIENFYKNFIKEKFKRNNENILNIDYGYSL